jgi:hypothetical protein
MRLDLNDANPFAYLGGPLKAAVDQIGQGYMEAVNTAAPDRFVTRIKRILQRDDLLAADQALCLKLNGWSGQVLPSDALRRRAMADPVRALNQIRLDAPTAEMLRLLGDLWAAIEAEGLDRPIARPTTAQPSVRDLQLVAWELVVGPEGLDLLKEQSWRDELNLKIQTVPTRLL